jgi:CRISPR-associated protein (TIGR03986 family)
VPLPETVVAAVDDAKKLPWHDRYYPDRRTGHFDVTLTTRSPLYVRCPFRLEDFLRQERGDDAGRPFAEQVKNTPHFFHTGDPAHPVIPGSSLRGMLRALLEIVSYGKVDHVTDRQLFFRTVDDTAVGRYYRSRMAGKVESGFLRRHGDGYVIRVCSRARVYRDQLGRIYDGRGPNQTPRWNGQPHQWMPVWVHVRPGRPGLDPVVEEIRYQHQPNLEEGRLVITGDVPRKKKEFVFLLPDPKAEEIPVPEEILERFHDDDQITQWQGSAFPHDRPQNGCRPRDGMIRQNPADPGDPVFFLRENGGLTFFGRAMMFRLPYQQCPAGLVPPELQQQDVIDYAEAMFGYTKGRQGKAKQGDPERAYAGRVFVTDAVLAEQQMNIWLETEPTVPRILASPKATAFQHYLTQQEPNNRDRLDHYGSPPERTTLRGHKLYWHQGERTAAELRPEPGSPGVDEQGNIEPQSTQHTRFRPVRAGVRFQFRLHFENLSDEELGALCWVLHPLGDAAKDYCHSLGMGKPLGMGAVKLEATLHLCDRPKRYGSLFEGDGWQTGLAGPVETLSDRAALERRTRPFEQGLLETLNPQPPCEHLFGLKRIAMLLKLLEWPGFPPDLALRPDNRYLAREERPNTRYMAVQLPGISGGDRNEYRGRPVLPDPSAFGDLTGQSVPMGTPTSPGGSGPPGGEPAKPAAPRLPNNGDHVQAVLVADPKGKNRPFAQLAGSDLVGPIQNPQDGPSDKKIGDRVTLVVKSISSDGKQIQFRWPTAADQQKPKAGPGKPPPGRKPGGPPRRH